MDNVNDQFEYNGFTVKTELKRATNFTIDVVDNISRKSYQLNTNINDIITLFKKDYTYRLMKNAFSKKANYHVFFTEQDNGNLLIEFVVYVDVNVKTDFSIILPEKQLTEIEILTIRIEEMEVKHKKEIDEIKNTCERLEKMIEQKKETHDLFG